MLTIGVHLTPFWSPTDRGATCIIDEAKTVVAAASRMGFAWVSIGQHWVSHPTVWPQPFPILARLAPETGAMRLKTSVLLLPILNPVETAENVATLDHVCHGRLDVGVAIGYREPELEAAGLARKDRAPKLEESLALMKRLWRGEEVTFHGTYTRLTAGRMGFTPFQKPHPPLEMGAQSEAAARRAARLTPRAPPAPARDPTRAGTAAGTEGLAPIGARAPAAAPRRPTGRAHSVMRRPPQHGQKPRALHENGTSPSSAHSVHRRRAKPCARIPQVRKSRNSCSTKAAAARRPPAAGSLEEGVEMLVDHAVQHRVLGVAGPVVADGAASRPRWRATSSRPSTNARSWPGWWKRGRP